MCSALRKKQERCKCPVCGFMMKYPPEDFNICPSCGVEFGAETSSYTFSELRNNWVRRGAPWSSWVEKPPDGWNPWVQLIDARLEFDFPFHVEPASTETARGSLAAVPMIIPQDRWEHERVMVALT